MWRPRRIYTRSHRPEPQEIGKTEADGASHRVERRHSHRLLHKIRPTIPNTPSKSASFSTTSTQTVISFFSLHAHAAQKLPQVLGSQRCNAAKEAAVCWPHRISSSAASKLADKADLCECGYRPSKIVCICSNFILNITAYLTKPAVHVWQNEAFPYRRVKWSGRWWKWSFIDTV